MEQKQELMKLSRENEKFMRIGKELKIVDEPSLKQSIDVLGQIKENRNRIDEARRFFTDPLNAQVKQINAEFKKMLEPLDEIERIIKSKMGEYHAEQERIRIAEQKRLEEIALKEHAKEVKKAEKKDEPPPVFIAPIVPKAPTFVNGKISSMVVKKVWDFEITDEMQIPLEYWLIDLKAVREAIRGGTREIPGIRIFQKDQIGVLQPDKELFWKPKKGGN